MTGGQEIQIILVLRFDGNKTLTCFYGNLFNSFRIEYSPPEIGNILILVFNLRSHKFANLQNMPIFGRLIRIETLRK